VRSTYCELMMVVTCASRYDCDQRDCPGHLLNTVSRADALRVSSQAMCIHISTIICSMH